MTILFDLNHPAHFHLFHYIIKDLSESNRIIITAKEKDVLLSLLDRNGFSPIVLERKKRRQGLWFSGLSLIKRDLRLLRIVKKEKPDILIGTSISIAHVGSLLGIPSIYFGEDGYKAVPLSYKIGYPFVTHIVSPSCVSVGKFHLKKLAYEGYHELAYLSPDTFSPSEIILAKYNLTKNVPYYLIRFSALEAHHDIGKKGIEISLALKIIQRLGKVGKVLISSEKPLPREIERFRLIIDPEDIHHIISYSNILISDSQTMTVEAAILGTPSIRYSSFVGQLAVLEELEKTYGLTFGILPGQEESLLEKLDYLLNIDKNYFKAAHQRMLNDKINVRKFFVWLIGNYPESIRLLKNNRD
jgi:uncharacterized protein